MAYLEDVCDLRCNDVYCTGYRRENGLQLRDHWGRGCVSSAIFVELENIAEDFTRL